MTGSVSIRVAVVDDQPLFVKGLSMLIESQPDLELVGTAADGGGAVDLVAAKAPDVVLMDIRMPVMSGLEAAWRITSGGQRREAPRIVVLTTFRQEEAVVRALRSGAAAYLTKDAEPETVLDTVRAVHAGDAGPASVRALLARTASAPVDAAPEQTLASLSAREREIFLLAAKGLSNSEIAASAFVSETTVKTHISSILGKLGLRSRAQIVVLAYESGLVKG